MENENILRRLFFIIGVKSQTLSVIALPLLLTVSKPSFSPFSLLRHRSLSHSLKFRLSFSFKSPTSTLRAFDVEEDDDEEKEEDDDDEDEDDDVVSGEVDDEGEAFEVDALARHDDGVKWQRVEKLCNEVREFGAGIIDVDELGFVYDFRIDKFQGQWLAEERERRCVVRMIQKFSLSSF